MQRDDSRLYKGGEFWRPRIAAVAVGLALTLGIFTGSCWWHIFYYHSASCSEYKPDFVAFYSGAKLIWEERSSLYDLNKQLAIQKSIDPSHRDWVLPYVYPPFFAWFLVPLSWMSFSAAFAVTTVANLLFLVSTVMLLIRRLKMSKEQSQWLVLSTICNFGVNYGLLQGQTSLIALQLLTLFVFASIGKRPVEVGFWSGLIAFKPQLLLVPTLMLLNPPRWRPVLIFVAVIFALSLLSYELVGLQGITEYLGLMGQAIARKDVFRDYPERMHNLRALAYFLFPLGWRDYVWWGASLAILVSFVRLCRVIPKDESSLAVKWIKIFLAMMLLTPHFHDHDLTLMIIPSAFILKLYDEVVPSYVSLSLVVVGLLPLIRNTLNIPLFPIMPIIFLVLFFIDLRPPKAAIDEPDASR